MPFSASTRPAPSSALPSGITSARGLPFQTSRRSHTCHLLSGTAALPADCRHFCPYYFLYVGSASNTYRILCTAAKLVMCHERTLRRGTEALAVGCHMLVCWSWKATSGRAP